MGQCSWLQDQVLNNKHTETPSSRYQIGSYQLSPSSARTVDTPIYIYTHTTKLADSIHQAHDNHVPGKYCNHDALCDKVVVQQHSNLTRAEW